MVAPTSTISFNLNDEQVELTNVSPYLTLLEWLRAQPGLTGTKKMCGEGGCGCCVVSVTRKDPVTGKDSTIAINSCLCPLYSVNGWIVKTTEGIGNSKKGFHPIQKAVAQYNGTQCGYCTPGFVMSMYSLTKENSNCTVQQIEDNFDGNICRCTGYRPILDAMKSLAVDTDTKQSLPLTDLEDLCPKLCSSCPAKISDWVIPNRNHGDVTWYAPTNLTDVFDIFKNSKTNKVKLICGNTGQGIFKNEAPIEILVDIKNIQPLSLIQCTESTLTVGATVSINRLVQTLMDYKQKSGNFVHLANHLKKVANVAVRNIGSWAGNLMLTHDNNNFPSDIYTMMNAVGATVTIATDKGTHEYSLAEFIKLDMTSSVIVSLVIPFSNNNTLFRSYKISPRAENAHAYVNAAFQIEMDSDNKTVKGSPSFVFGGIEEHSISAKQTESFMINKDITCAETLQTALEILSKEINPIYLPIASSQEHRKSLAVNLFYKFYLSILGDRVNPLCKSAATIYTRPISKGSQDFDSDQTQYPVTQPMPKLTSALQASGEAQYTSDFPKQYGELIAAFVLSTQGNAEILSIDTTLAMSIDGAVQVITANDIPGINDFTARSSAPEPIIVDKYVEYAGQPVAIVIADSQTNADRMAKTVTVQYRPLGKPILTIQQAIEMESFHNDPNLTTINIGNTEDALLKSDHVITGELHCPSQYHFHMETHIAVVIPEDDGYTVHSSTQSVRGVQTAVATILGIDNNRVNVSVKRVGGGYGAKLFRAGHIAGACAVGAHITGRPVRMHIDLDTNMKSIGKRFPYYAKYTVGSTDTGLLDGVKVDVYSDAGCYQSENAIHEALFNFDNVYKCSNWLLTPKSCKTHTPSNTYCRAPGYLPVVFMIESIMDHLAMSLKMDPCALKELNLYKQGDVSYVSDIRGMPLNYCNIRELWKDIKKSADVENRKQQITTFNKANRWRKRGLSVVPMRYGLMWTGHTTTVLVSIYAKDGTVSIVHGGVEIGQGINTKVAQIAAGTLGICVNMIQIKPTNSLTNPNGSSTGGCITSEMNCKAVLEACKSLKRELDGARDVIIKEGNGDPKWLEVVKKANSMGVDLSSKGFICGKSNYFFDYNAYGVTCAEVEIDVLTGQTEVLRVDILNDCGESMNPEIDIGQVEGGFIMGLGYWLTEKLIYDSTSGQLLTHNTWEYKPPSSKDIPQDMRVTLLKNVPNPLGVLPSKGVGEPPLVMSCVVVFAIKRAIESARRDTGNNELLILPPPVTVDSVQTACLTDISQLILV